MSKTSFMKIRIETDAFEEFKRVSNQVHGKKYTDLLREMVIAINESRLKIKPTKEQAIEIVQNSKLYEVNQDG